MAATPSLTIPDAKAADVLKALEWKYKAEAIARFHAGDPAAYEALTSANKYRQLMRVSFKILYTEYLKANPNSEDLDIT